MVSDSQREELASHVPGATNLSQASPTVYASLIHGIKCIQNDYSLIMRID